MQMLVEPAKQEPNKTTQFYNSFPLQEEWATEQIQLYKSIFQTLTWSSQLELQVTVAFSWNIQWTNKFEEKDNPSVDQSMRQEEQVQQITQLPTMGLRHRALVMKILRVE